VAVVTALDSEGRPHGLTVSAVCSVSQAPPLVLACLDLDSNTLAVLSERGGFTINYLAEGREEVALQFATKSPSKFTKRAWLLPHGGGGGGPVLADDIAAYAICDLHETVRAGDHAVVIGVVRQAGVEVDRNPLVFARRRFFAVPAFPFTKTC
jgi:flavin reductase (DIM6/NTAB) family NADH-FMN oxidoreductase RutF